MPGVENCRIFCPLESPCSASGLSNTGPHGFSDLLYTYTSAAATNGSAFTGSYANTPFYNLTLALAMLCGRFLVIVPVLAIAGSFVAKKNGPGLGRHLSNRWDAIRLSTRRHRIDCRCSHLHPSARARSPRRAVFLAPTSLIRRCGSCVASPARDQVRQPSLGRADPLHQTSDSKPTKIRERPGPLTRLACYRAFATGLHCRAV
jgi:hypothetical protein